MKNITQHIIIITCVLIILAALYMSAKTAFDLPIVARDINRQCVYVERKGVRTGCENLPSKYHSIVVARNG